MGGPGIGVCRWENGALSLLGAYHDLNDTTYAILSADHRTLFTAGSLPETGEGAVASYRVAGDTLSLLSCRKTAGKAACLCETHTDIVLLTSAYHSGSRFIVRADYFYTVSVRVFLAALEYCLVERVFPLVHHDTSI